MAVASGTGDDNIEIAMSEGEISPPEPSSAPRPGRSPNTAQAVLLGSAGAQLGLALLITIYLARVLSPAAFGFFALVGTIFVLARKFLDLGLGSVAARDIARDAQRERPILEGTMAYRRAAGLALALVVFVFALTQKESAERWVLLAASVVLLFNEPAALDPVFQVRQAQGGPAVLTVFGGVVVLVGSLLFKRAGVAGAAFAWLVVLREAITLFGTYILAQRLLGYHPKPGFRGRALRAFVGPALLFGLASLVYTIYFHGDVFFVYALRGKDELGAYAAAFRPINPLLLLPWVLMMPLIPVFSATAFRDMTGFVGQVRSACALALGLGACGAVAGTMLAPDLVLLLYKGRYLHGPLSSVDAFRCLAVALGMVFVTSVMTASLLAAGEEKVLLWIGSGALAANATLNLVLLRHHNFTAAGFATAASELLFMLGGLIAFRIVTGQSALSWSSVPYLTPAICLGGVLAFVPGGPVLRVACGIVTGAIAVTVILFMPDARQFRKQIAGASSAAGELPAAMLAP